MRNENKKKIIPSKEYFKRIIILKETSSIFFSGDRLYAPSNVNATEILVFIGFTRVLE